MTRSTRPSAVASCSSSRAVAGEQLDRALGQPGLGQRLARRAPPAPRSSAPRSSSRAARSRCRSSGTAPRSRSSRSGAPRRSTATTPERHPELAQLEAALERASLELLADRIGQRDDRPHALGHRRDPLGRQRQPVAKRRRRARRRARRRGRRRWPRAPRRRARRAARRAAPSAAVLGSRCRRSRARATRARALSQASMHGLRGDRHGHAKGSGGAARRQRSGEHEVVAVDRLLGGARQQLRAPAADFIPLIRPSSAAE